MNRPEYFPAIDDASTMLRRSLPERVEGVVVLTFEKDTFNYAAHGADVYDLMTSLRRIADEIEEDIKTDTEAPAVERAVDVAMLRSAVEEALKFVARYRSIMPDYEDALDIDEEECAEEREIVDEHERVLRAALQGKSDDAASTPRDLKDEVRA